MEEEDFPCPSLFFFKQQTFQTPNNKSNPNQAFQNAITPLLLLSHKKNPHTPPSLNIQLSRQILHCTNPQKANM